MRYSNYLQVKFASILLLEPNMYGRRYCMIRNYSTGASPNVGPKLLEVGEDVYSDFTELPFRHY